MDDSGIGLSTSDHESNIINQKITSNKADVVLNFSYDCLKQEQSVETFLKSEHKAFGCAYCEYRSRYRGDVYKHQGRRHQDRQRSLLKYYESGNVVCLPVKQPEKIKSELIAATPEFSCDSIGRNNSNDNSFKNELDNNGRHRSQFDNIQTNYLNATESLSFFNQNDKLQKLKIKNQNHVHMCATNTRLIDDMQMTDSKLDSDNHRDYCNNNDKHNSEIFICSRCGFTVDIKSNVQNHICNRNGFEDHYGNVAKQHFSNDKDDTNVNRTLPKSLHCLSTDMNVSPPPLSQAPRFNIYNNLTNAQRDSTIANNKYCPCANTGNQEHLPKKRVKLENSNISDCLPDHSYNENAAFQDINAIDCKVVNNLPPLQSKTKKRTALSTLTTNSVKVTTDRRKSRKSDNSTHIVGYKKIKCKHCFYRSNWKGDLVRHVTKEHNGVPSEDIGFLSEYDATRTFDEYERTFGRLLRSRLLIGLIEYKDVPWTLALTSLARNITAATRQAMMDGIVPKINHRLTRISAEFLRLMQSTSIQNYPLDSSNHCSSSPNTLISASGFYDTMNTINKQSVNNQNSLNTRASKSKSDDGNFGSDQLNGSNIISRNMSGQSLTIDRKQIKSSYDHCDNEEICIDLSIKGTYLNDDYRSNICEQNVVSKAMEPICIKSLSPLPQPLSKSIAITSTNVPLEPTVQSFNKDQTNRDPSHLTIVSPPVSVKIKHRIINCSLCSTIWMYRSLSEATRHHDLHMTAGGYECMACHCCSYFRSVIAIHNIKKHGNCAFVRQIRRFGTPECKFTHFGEHLKKTKVKHDNQNAEEMLSYYRSLNSCYLENGKNVDKTNIINDLTGFRYFNRKEKSNSIRKRKYCCYRKVYCSKPLDNDSIFVCSYCIYSSQDWWDFMQHRQIHRLRKGAIFHCAKCTSFFTTTAELLKHKKLCIARDKL